MLDLPHMSSRTVPFAFLTPSGTCVAARPLPIQCFFQKGWRLAASKLKAPTWDVTSGILVPMLIRLLLFGQAYVSVRIKYPWMGLLGNRCASSSRERKGSTQLKGRCRVASMKKLNLAILWAQSSVSRTVRITFALEQLRKAKL